MLLITLGIFLALFPFAALIPMVTMFLALPSMIAMGVCLLRRRDVGILLDHEYAQLARRKQWVAQLPSITEQRFHELQQASASRNDRS